MAAGKPRAWDFSTELLDLTPHHINGHFTKLEVPTICKGYVREYPHKIWLYIYIYIYMEQYLYVSLVCDPEIPIDHMLIGLGKAIYWRSLPGKGWQMVPF